MGTKIQYMKPPCGYVIDGIDAIRFLDFDKFKLFKFLGDGLYDNCTVISIKRSGDFIGLPPPEIAEYESTTQNGLYTHTLKAFISDLDGETSANLHLFTKRRFVPVFHTKNGRYMCFGYEAGATLSYSGQTNNGTGYMITFTANSIYPLFEVLSTGGGGWILENGTWEDGGTWTTNGVWKSKQ